MLRGDAHLQPTSQVCIGMMFSSSTERHRPFLRFLQFVSRTQDAFERFAQLEMDHVLQLFRKGSSLSNDPCFPMDATGAVSGARARNRFDLPVLSASIIQTGEISHSGLLA